MAAVHIAFLFAARRPCIQTQPSVIMNGPWLRWLYNVSTKKIPKLEFLEFLQLQKIVKPVKDIGLPPKYLIKYIVWICCLINGFFYSLDP